MRKLSYRSVHRRGPQMWSVDTVLDVPPPGAVRALRDLAAQKRAARVTTRRLSRTTHMEVTTLEKLQLLYVLQ